MLFKDCKFKDKTSVRKTFKEAILINVKENVPFQECNYGRVLEYIDLLLDESHYNVREEVFYYKYRWVKIELTVELFSKVASEYINENLDYFLLEKHKNTLEL